MDLEKLAYAGLGAALTFIYFAFGRSQAPEKAQAKNEHIPGAFDDQPSAGQKKSKKKAKGGQKQTDESVVKGTVVESGQGKAALDAEVTKPAGMPPIPNEGQGNASKAKKPTKTDTEKTKKGELVALSATKESKETTTADASAPKPAASTKKAEPSAPKPDTKGKSVAQQPTASYANAASITSTTDSQKNDRKIVLEPKPEKGAKWLDTDQPEVLTAHRVMKIVEPKPVEKPRLPEAEGWTTVKAKCGPRLSAITRGFADTSLISSPR